MKKIISTLIGLGLAAAIFPAAAQTDTNAPDQNGNPASRRFFSFPADQNKAIMVDHLL